jgi:hypothetical protein
MSAQPSDAKAVREIKADVASADKSREFLAAAGALRLIKPFDRFPSMKMRTSFVQLAESLAKGGKARHPTAAGHGTRRRDRSASEYAPGPAGCHDGECQPLAIGVPTCEWRRRLVKPLDAWPAALVH